MKKIKVLILVMSILFTNVFVFADGIYSDQLGEVTKTNDEWTVLMQSYGLPINTPKFIKVKGEKIPFNEELLEDKGVVVYGDYTMIPKNDFKDTNNGYYILGNRVGEYRYHGYTDVEGYHGNDAFPRDASSSTPLENKKWIIKPWEKSSFAKASFDRHSDQANNINLAATKYIDLTNEQLLNMLSPEEYEEQITMRKISSDGMKFTIKDGSFDGNSKYIRPSDNSVVTDPIFYANMQTVPTTRLAGQSILFHKSKWDNKTWYQTFSMARTKEKLMTDVEATIDDYFVSSIDNTGKVTLSVSVVGHLKDDDFYIPKNELSSATEAQQIDNFTRYHRDDILAWDINLNSINLPVTFVKQGSAVRFNGGNKAYQLFTVDLEYADYEAIVTGKTTFELSVKGKTIVNFTEGKTNHDEVIDSIEIDSGEVKTEIPELPLPDEPDPIKFDITAPNEILDVWNFPLLLTEVNIPVEYDRSVILEGVTLTEEDEAKFISGTYKFPEIRETKIYNYKVVYTDGDKTYHYASWIMVYDSIPHASVRVNDSAKVNRKNTITTDTSVTPNFVEANSSISITNFSITARNGQQVHFGTNTSALKEYLVKTIDTVDVSVTVTNEFGSRNYSHEIYAGEDYIPDLISIVWNNNLARGDSLDIFSEAASLDGDTVGPTYYEIFYDSDDDGIAETSVYPKSEFNGTTPYKPTKLGYYEIEFTVTEAFGEETIEAFINPEDYMSNTVRREFFVDNLVPMTKLYTDIEPNFPEIDMTFLVDQAYPRSEMNFISSNAVEIRNNFRLNNMVTSLQTWDMHTYVYSQNATTSLSTGGSYPPSSTSFSTGGYSGTLSRYRVDNYDYTVDQGKNVTTTDSKSASYSMGLGGTVMLPDIYGPPPPSSVSYDQGGYTGTLSQSGGLAGYSSTAIMDKDDIYIGYTWSATQHYSGTVTKSTTVWVPKIVHYDDYVGRYSGTVYKHVKQSFNPSYSTSSNKYVVYFATNSISNVSDYQRVKNIALESKLIVVGNPSIKGNLGEDIFIAYSSNTQTVIDNIVNVVKQENPFNNELAILVNESFNLSYADIDAEGDPIVEEGFQYIHEPDYFDNSLGQESDTDLSYLDSQYSTIYKNSFSKPGKYSIYRRIKDEPVDFPSLGRYSNLGKYDLVVHRRPIANDTLDVFFDPVEGKYRSSYMDSSYDPDYELSDVNKGIVQWKVRMRRNGGSWIYGVPEFLVHGTWERELVVRDKHGVDSLPYYSTIVLEAVPSPQILTAELEATLSSKFSLTSIPASEDMTFNNVKTRFPYGEFLQMAIYNTSGSRVTNNLSVYNNGSNTSEFDQDLTWDDTIYNIPKTLADGNYHARIYALDEVNTNNNVFKSFNITVNTPVNLATDFAELTGNSDNTITTTTSVYVNNMQLEMFRGHATSNTVVMTEIANDGVTKTWSYNYYGPDETVVEGDYNARFTARTPNGNVEVIDRPFYLVHLRIEDVRLWGDWNHWRGQVDKISGLTLATNPHRFMSHENINIEADVVGDPDSVTIELSPELEALVYRNTLGHTYRHDFDFGLPAETFPLSMQTSNQYNYSREYILPLADWTLDYENNRHRGQYWITVTATKGSTTRSVTINDIELTGNIHDMIYYQPEE